MQIMLVSAYTYEIYVYLHTAVSDENFLFFFNDPVTVWSPCPKELCTVLWIVVRRLPIPKTNSWAECCLAIHRKLCVFMDFKASSDWLRQWDGEVGGWHHDFHISQWKPCIHKIQWSLWIAEHHSAQLNLVPRTHSVSEGHSVFGPALSEWTI